MSEESSLTPPLFIEPEEDTDISLLECAMALVIAAGAMIIDVARTKAQRIQDAIDDFSDPYEARFIDP